MVVRTTGSFFFSRLSDSATKIEFDLLCAGMPNVTILD